MPVESELQGSNRSSRRLVSHNERGFLFPLEDEEEEEVEELGVPRGFRSSSSPSPTQLVAAFDAPNVPRSVSVRVSDFFFSSTLNSSATGAALLVTVVRGGALKLPC